MAARKLTLKEPLLYFDLDLAKTEGEGSEKVYIKYVHILIQSNLFKRDVKITAEQSRLKQS
jgi:hypothetical protein